LPRMRAYILIKVNVNSEREVAEKIRKLASVESADLVTGPYDIIAVTQAKDLNDIADLVTSRLLTVSDVTSTTTCLATKTR
jgi:DNA-binding Lrp family transcriptional regulator